MFLMVSSFKMYIHYTKYEDLLLALRLPPPQDLGFLVASRLPMKAAIVLTCLEFSAGGQQRQGKGDLVPLLSRQAARGRDPGEQFKCKSSSTYH